MKVASPFRYPGAKSRMVKQLLPMIVPHVERAQGYCDPFVGGGSVALAVAAAVPRAHLLLNDADADVAAFWSVLAWGVGVNGLLRRVSETVPTVEMHDAMREASGGSQLDRAFRALFLNRTSFSGIIGAGPIGGRRQASRWGVGCRWNPVRLCEQLESAHKLLRGRTTVSCTTFQRVIIRNLNPCYLDPPYWEKGRMCYRAGMTEDEHRELARMLQHAFYHWVLSYDAHPEVAKLYKFADVRTVGAAYSMSGAGRQSWVDAKELVIQPHTGAGS